MRISAHACTKRRTTHHRTAIRLQGIAHDALAEKGDATRHPIVHQCERVGLGELRFECVTSVPVTAAATVPAPAPATAPPSAPAPAFPPSHGRVS